MPRINYKHIISAVASILCLVGGYVISSLTNTEAQQQQPRPEIVTEIKAGFNIELSTTQVQTLLETEDGEVEIIEAPTVERIDSNNLACDEGEECGKGSYIYAPTETYTQFKDYTLGKCWNTDGYYGAQCWDLGDLFWQNYSGRNLSTCGTGAAKGAWDCKEINAGDDFELITNKEELQAGDWIIFNTGQWGHVGMALGAYNNGYIALLGQNQGGGYCEGGGSSTNIINISLKDFAGAFRPKTYIKPEPTPEPIPITGCTEWDVYEGDTMSGIMLQCEGTVVYGQAMDNYAKSWYSRYYRPNQSVYDGWHSESGVGLYAGDTIVHKTE